MRRVADSERAPTPASDNRRIASIQLAQRNAAVPVSATDRPAGWRRPSTRPSGSVRMIGSPDSRTCVVEFEQRRASDRPRGVRSASIDARSTCALASRRAARSCVDDMLRVHHVPREERKNSQHDQQHRPAATTHAVSPSAIQRSAQRALTLARSPQLGASEVWLQRLGNPRR